MSAWRAEERTINLEAPGENDWEGDHVLGLSTEYSVNTQFNYIHYTPMGYSNQGVLADWVVKASNSGQLTITLY